VNVVRLESLAVQHLDALCALFDDPDMQRFTRLPVPTPPGFARTWVEGYDAGRVEGARAGFAVIGEDGDFLGIYLSAFRALSIRCFVVSTPAKRSPCLRTRPSTTSMVNAAGSSDSFTSSQRSGVETGAPGRGRTE
jgi:hypothetical protein